MALSNADVREILRLIDSSDLDELRIETPGLSLHVRRRAAPSASAASADRAPQAAEPPAGTGLVDVTAPMLGTFYRAEAPGAQPFVEIGTRVEAGTIVGLIEVMKLMNHVAANVAGTVVELCAGDGDLVEFDQPLVRVDPGR